jgi:hypothetical protein
MLGLKDHLQVHLDVNGWQGSCRTFADTVDAMHSVFRIRAYHTKRGAGVRLFEEHEDWHTHLITDAEFAQIMEDLK